MSFARFDWGFDLNDDNFVGEDLAVETEWRDVDTDALIDFTGYTATMEMRKRPGETPVHTGTVTFPSTGVVRADVSDATTTAMGAGDWCFDIRATAASGSVDYMFGGRLRLKDPCTA